MSGKDTHPLNINPRNSFARAGGRLPPQDTQLRLALQSAGIGWWDWDVAADALIVDDHAAALFGLSASLEPRFDLLLESVHPEDRTMVQRKVAEALGAPGEHEIEFRTKRRTQWLALRCRAFPDGHGNPSRLIGIVMDCTRRRQTDAQLRQRAEEVETLMEVVPIPIWVAHDTQCREVTGNRAASDISCRGPEKVDLWTTSASDVSSASVRYLQDGKELSAGELPMQVAVQKDIDVRDVEVEIVHPDGTRRVLWGNASPLHNLHGEVRGAVGGFVDITAQKQVEAELRALTGTLEHRVAERALEAEQRAAQLRALASELAQTEERERRVLAQILHDQLQQLLVAARLKVEILRQGVQDEALAQVVHDLDQLVRQSIAESRSLTLELSPAALYQGGLAVGLEWLGRQLEEKYGLFVEVHASDDANPPDEATRVSLFQAVRELLFNVVKHARVDRAVVRLRRADPRTIQVEVSDNGCGCDPSGLDSRATAHGSFGLFSVCERLRLLDGRLEVQTAPGQGMRVVITVPTVPPAVADEPPADRLLAGGAVPQTPSNPSRLSPSDKLCVLLVEDNPVLRQGLADRLRGEPQIAELLLACDGQEAVEVALRSHPDVIVMDIAMPRLNGVEATRRITARLPGVRIIALSMYDTADMAPPLAEAGAVVYLRKDSCSEDLIAAILGH